MENNQKNETFHVGDYIIYVDRETYLGTIKSLDIAMGTAKIKVPLTCNNKMIMEEMTVPISKLKKRVLS